MSSWSATAFSPVFGESAARISTGLAYGTILLLPTATEDRLGAELWGVRPAVPNNPDKTWQPTDEEWLAEAISAE